jgi:hypothetical protein
MRQALLVLVGLFLMGLSAKAQQNNETTSLSPMKPQSPMETTVIHQPGGNITITGFFRYENFSPRIWLRSSKPALVDVTIKDSDGVSVGQGKVQLLQKGMQKDIDAFGDIDEEHGGMTTGNSYKIQLSAQYVQEAPTVTEIESPAPSVSVWYAMAGKPDKVTQISDVSKPWNLKITVNRAGKAKLTFYDDQNLIPNSFKKEFDASGSDNNLNKEFNINVGLFKDGYYRYHISGESLEQQLSLVEENESFLLVIDTQPVLEGLLKLEIKPDGSSAHLSFQLSQKIKTELRFPGNLSLGVDGVGDKPPYTYDQNVSTDSVALIQKLTGAASRDTTGIAGTKVPQPIDLKLIAMSGPHQNEEIAEISLQGLQSATTAATIAKLKSVQGTLKPAEATQTAKEALGLQNEDTSKDPQASAVQYLASVLTQKNSNKDKFLEFLAVAGNVALTYYGVPAKIPTKAK